MSLKKVQAAVAAGPPPVCVVVGDAGPLVDRATDLFVQWGLERCGLPQFNYDQLRVEDGDADRALIAARTLPMMADKRLIVLRGLEHGDNALFERLLAYSQKPSESTLLVAVGVRIPKKAGKDYGSRIRNALSKKGAYFSFLQKDANPGGFAVAHARSLGRVLDRRVADLLVALVGADLGRLAQEIEKICLYSPEGPITAEDVAAASSLLAEAVGWDLTTAIATRDPNRAIEQLHRLLEHGDAPRRLLGLIGWKLRQLAIAVELVARGASQDEIRASRLSWDVVGAVKKRGAAAFPPAAVLLGRLSAANRDMNLHRAGDRRILERLVVELCQ